MSMFYGKASSLVSRDDKARIAGIIALEARIYEALVERGKGGWTRWIWAKAGDNEYAPEAVD